MNYNRYKTKILCVVGTRPEAIKMAPIIILLKNAPWADVRILSTAQHRGLLDQVLKTFNIKANIDLNVMREKQELPAITSQILLESDNVLRVEKPDVVLIQGDTTTVMTVALACFYRHIDIGHVEAGLRTWDMKYPFPEEANRVITSRLARWHFAPTDSSRRNLLQEGISDNSIHVTGNTVIDALHMTNIKDIDIGAKIDSNKRLILITAHRRENFGRPIYSICRAIQTLASLNKDIQFLYPVHPNPNVADVAYELLDDCDNIFLVAPMNYPSFVYAMKKSYLILSDSGGVQEEGPALGKPVLVMRNESERPEAIERGVAKIVGTSSDRIVNEVQRLIDDSSAYHAMARGISPYGDGHAATRIVNTLKEHFS